MRAPGLRTGRPDVFRDRLRIMESLHSSLTVLATNLPKPDERHRGQERKQMIDDTLFQPLPNWDLLDGIDPEENAVLGPEENLESNSQNFNQIP